MPSRLPPTVAVSLAAWMFAVCFAGCDSGGSPSRDAGDADADAADDEDGEGGADADADADADSPVEADLSAEVDAEAEADADAVASFHPDPDRMMDDIRELTSDPYAGRLAGTAGDTMSLDFGETRLESLGLEAGGDAGGFRQAFRFEQWVQTVPAAVALSGTALAEGTDYAVFYESGSGTVDAEIIFAGYGMTVPPFDPAAYPDCPFPATGYDDYSGIDPTGAIALVLRHGPADDVTEPDVCPANAACAAPPCLWNFGYKAANARLHGAAAMMVVQDFAEAAAIPEGVTLERAYYAADFPAIVVDRDLVVARVPDLATWAGAIDAALAPAGQATGVTASIRLATTVRTVDTANLIGVVPGSDPARANESVVLGAHIDHVGIDLATGEMYRGADDNASGTAVLFELARGVTETGLVPVRTLVFAVFDAEEAGLVGSLYYVEHPPYAIADVAAMFSLDMVGAGDGTGLALYGTTAASLRWLATLMEAAAAEAGLSYVVARQVPIDLSDHATFAAAGAPAVMATTLGPHATYHTAADTVDGILPEDLVAAAELMWVELVPLALGTESAYLGKSGGPSRAAPALRTLERERRLVR
jgi:hypothetical protein